MEGEKRGKEKEEEQKEENQKEEEEYISVSYRQSLVA